MGGWVLFILFAGMLLVAAYVLWRYWADLTIRTTDEERFEERVAALNERQANRYSDDELTEIPSDDDAWRIMVDRGRRASRRDRYAGDLQRRRRKQ